MTVEIQMQIWLEERRDTSVDMWIKKSRDTGVLTLTLIVTN